MKTNNLIQFAKLALVSLILFNASCSDESFEAANDTDQSEVVQKYFGDVSVYVSKSENGKWLADDMEFDNDQLSDVPLPSAQDRVPDEEIQAKLSLASYANKWANNTVIYRISNLNSNLRSELQKAISEWSTKTNVRFKERTNESTYVTISESTDVCSGCGRATIGARGNSGTLLLGRNAGASLIAHEIGHTLGFLHEQTRPDRDNHVRIIFSNIKAGFEGNFQKSSSALLTTKDFDIKSIMMYHPYAFAIDRSKPTIVDVRTNQAYTGAQQSISALDIQGTNSVYRSTNPNPSDICAGIAEYNRNTRYNVGDKVVYNDYLYELDFSAWNRLGKCGTSDPQPVDKCQGVSAYNSNTRYSPGDKVVYNNTLYTLTNENRWRNDGACGS